MPRRKTGRKRGRPRNPNAKRRHTTRAGRRLGYVETPELHRRKIAVGAGRNDLEIAPASVLFARDHLDRTQFDCLSQIADTLRKTHAAVPGVNVSGLWRAITAAASRAAYRGPSADALGLAVASARRFGWILQRVDGSRALIVELAEGKCPPIVVRAYDNALTIDDRTELETLRRGLDAVAMGPRRGVYRE